MSSYEEELIFGDLELPSNFDFVDKLSQDAETAGEIVEEIVVKDDEIDDLQQVLQQVSDKAKEEYAKRMKLISELSATDRTRVVSGKFTFIELNELVKELNHTLCTSNALEFSNIEDNDFLLVNLEKDGALFKMLAGKECTIRVLKLTDKYFDNKKENVMKLLLEKDCNLCEITFNSPFKLFAKNEDMINAIISLGKLKSLDLILPDFGPVITKLIESIKSPAIKINKLSISDGHSLARITGEQHWKKIPVINGYLAPSAFSVPNFKLICKLIEFAKPKSLFIFMENKLKYDKGAFSKALTCVDTFGILFHDTTPNSGNLLLKDIDRYKNNIKTMVIKEADTNASECVNVLKYSTVDDFYYLLAGEKEDETREDKLSKLRAEFLELIEYRAGINKPMKSIRTFSKIDADLSKAAASERIRLAIGSILDEYHTQAVNELSSNFKWSRLM